MVGGYCFSQIESSQSPNTPCDATLQFRRRKLAFSNENRIKYLLGR